MSNCFFSDNYAQYLCPHIAELYPGVIVVCDAEGRTLWANREFEKLTGYLFSEVQGIPPGKILQGKDTDAETVAFIREQMNKRNEFVCEILNYKKDGSSYWIELHAVPVIVNDELKFWLGTKHLIDAQLQKLMQEERILKDTLEQLRNVVMSY